MPRAGSPREAAAQVRSAVTILGFVLPASFWAGHVALAWARAIHGAFPQGLGVAIGIVAANSSALAGSAWEVARFNAGEGITPTGIVIRRVCGLFGLFAAVFAILGNLSTSGVALAAGFTCILLALVTRARPDEARAVALRGTCFAAAVAILALFGMGVPTGAEADVGWLHAGLRGAAAGAGAASMALTVAAWVAAFLRRALDGVVAAGVVAALAGAGAHFLEWTN